MKNNDVNENMNRKDPAQKPGVIILAAGKGTRMKSDKAKVLHTICGQPMLSRSIQVARGVGAQKIVIVIGHQADEVRAKFTDPDLTFVEQREQLGTGHAVMQARGEFEDFTGNVIILCGDVPLLSVKTIADLLETHIREQAVVTVLTAVLDDPASYGRIVKTSSGEVLKIVEARDASTEESQIREINSGIYCVDGRFLFEAVGRITNDNAQKEYYLTDIIEIACRSAKPVRAIAAWDAEEVLGINTLEELQHAEELLIKMSS